jgi:hypothetical protein
MITVLLLCRSSVVRPGESTDGTDDKGWDKRMASRPRPSTVVLFPSVRPQAVRGWSTVLVIVAILALLLAAPLLLLVAFALGPVAVVALGILCVVGFGLALLGLADSVLGVRVFGPFARPGRVLSHAPRAGTAQQVVERRR